MPNYEKARLHSWQEIARYLHRHVRTVRRWEKVMGLPVHRLPGGKRPGVFAYRAEIEAWLRGEMKPTERGLVSTHAPSSGK